jgi:hypothetical protein
VKVKFQVQDRQRWPFLMIPKAFLRRFKPSLRATGAYVALRYYARNDKGTCEGMSNRTLAELMNVSEDTIKRGLAELCAKKAVRKVKRSSRSTEGNRIPLPNLYVLLHIEDDEDPI